MSPNLSPVAGLFAIKSSVDLTPIAGVRLCVVVAIIWSCLAMSILLADVANNWMEIRSALSAPVRSRVPTKQNLPETAVETI